MPRSHLSHTPNLRSPARRHRRGRVRRLRSMTYPSYPPYGRPPTRSRRGVSGWLRSTSPRRRGTRAARWCRGRTARRCLRSRPPAARRGVEEEPLVGTAPREQEAIAAGRVGDVVEASRPLEERAFAPPAEDHQRAAVAGPRGEDGRGPLAPGRDCGGEDPCPARSRARQARPPSRSSASSPAGTRLAAARRRATTRARSASRSRSPRIPPGRRRPRPFERGPPGARS